MIIPQLRRLFPSLLALSIFLGIILGGCAGRKAQTAESGGASASPVPQGESIPLVGSSKVTRFVFDNGLRLLVVEDHSSPTFAYQTWFRIGARDEVPGRTGLAHLFEHMMFKGTTHLKDGEFDRLLEGAGVVGENAFTTRDFTAYVEELPKDKLDLVAGLEADRMVNLVVDDQAFKTEREVVQNERRWRYENNPDGLMYQELFGTAFTQHPYHWPVIGYTQDLESMTAEDARRFYKEHYSPNHATVIIVGDVTPAEAFRAVKTHYGALSASSAPPHVVEAEPPQEQPRRKTMKFQIQVQKMLIGYHIPSVVDPDVPALGMLQAILSSGKSSRLYRALVSTGLASGADSDQLEDKDPSLFMIVVNMQKGRKAAQAEAVVQREISRLMREPVSDKELDRARNALNFSFYESLDTDNSKARFLGTYEGAAGNFEYGINLHAKLMSVTAADVLTVAKRYFQPKNRTVIMGLPQ